MQVAVGAGDDADVDLDSARSRRPARTSRSCSARSSLAWSASGISAISSSSSVPPSAARKKPSLAPRRAGEGALLVAEQHRLEHRLGQRAQLIATNGLSRAVEPVVDDAASTSLPVPVGPLISTVMSAGGDALGEREQRERSRDRRRPGSLGGRATSARAKPSPIAASSLPSASRARVAVADGIEARPLAERSRVPRRRGGDLAVGDQ